MKKVKYIPIITALCGLILGLFPGLGPDIIDSIRYRDLPKIHGEWTGLFKEWCPEKDRKDTGKWTVSVERLRIKQRGSRITADSLTEDLIPREWEAVGRYRIPVLTLIYVESKPGILSIGSYVLEHDLDYGKFKGYWTGYDRDLKRIITCPCVLIQGRADRKKIEDDTELRKWLQQQCVVPKAELSRNE